MQQISEFDPGCVITQPGPEPELKDMSIKGLSALFTKVIDPDQFRELLAPGSNLPKGLS